MIAALGAEEAGSKDNEGSVALVQKRILRGVLFVATNQSRISCSREHLNGLSSREKMNSLQVSIWSWDGHFWDGDGTTTIQFARQDSLRKKIL